MWERKGEKGRGHVYMPKLRFILLCINNWNRGRRVRIKERVEELIRRDNSSNMPLNMKWSNG